MLVRARLLVIVWWVVGCGWFEGNPSRIIALEIIGGTSYSAQVGDTLHLKARARAANGDTVSGAVIEWAVLDTGTVGIALDPSTGVVVATAPGTWRVQAKVESIRSDAITIKVLARPTSLLNRPTGGDDGGGWRTMEDDGRGWRGWSAVEDDD